MEPKKSYFGAASVVFAVLSVVLPIAIGAFFGSRVENETSEQAKAWGPLIALFATIIVSFLVVGITSFLGSLSGLLALVRGERSSWLAVVGLIVNGPILVFLLFVFAVMQANGG
ncbi:MAG: hypothetical protein L0241_06545 [Planctomycetia bacterium]|nr:hypothetical protein [Planctomycetia bacterium]